MPDYDATISPPKVITFSSTNSLNETNSSFQSIPVDLGLNDYDSVVVVDANIPKSFYNFPSGYNTFILQEGATQVTITIPPASYNINNLLTVLTTLLSAGSPNTWDYLAEYSLPVVGDTMFITFTVSGNTSQPSIIMASNSTSPFRQLGFDNNSTNTFSGGALVSTNAVNLSLVLTAYIQTDMVLGANNGILQQFLNIGSYPPSSVIYFQQINYDLNARRFNKSQINSWNFKLTDGFFLPIDTNGVPWSFSILFFKRNITHEVQRQHLNIKNQERMYNIQKKQEDLLDAVAGLVAPNEFPTSDAPNDLAQSYPLSTVESSEPKIIYPRARGQNEIQYPTK